jgi:hypothetical protein
VALARFRRPIGAVECLGALGLLAGQFNRPVLVLAAAGLTLTMLMAIATRIRIGDSLAQTLPAIVLFALNAFVLGFAITQNSVLCGSKSSPSDLATAHRWRRSTTRRP